MGNIHKSKVCKQAHPLELSGVMGSNDNMVGGAGAAASSPDKTYIAFTTHNPHNPHKSPPWQRGGQVLR